jgi:hypothetical protein
MSAPVPKPFEDELADRTMELDMRWLHDQPESTGHQTPKTETIYDDPTIVLDLTATQVHDLLTKQK